eukprot:jgi/Astpho2/1862/fgenesh1_pg.00038_%23_28_t
MAAALQVVEAIALALAARETAESLQRRAEAMAERSSIRLPKEFIAVAAAEGLRRKVLESYLQLQGGAISGFFARNVGMLRNRMLADHRFLFKLFVEVAIDAGCATVAEVRKRGSDFWGEFEFYLSDLVVGCVLDCVLVSLLAPIAVLGPHAKSRGKGAIGQFLNKVPSAMFEASVPGVKTYTPVSRAACWLVKFAEYSLAGIFCGVVGQGIANGMMQLKRHYYGKQEHDLAIPDMWRTGLVWGLFMGVSSNTRYQIVFGLERIVDMSIAKKGRGSLINAQAQVG